MNRKTMLILLVTAAAATWVVSSTFAQPEQPAPGPAAPAGPDTRGGPGGPGGMPMGPGMPAWQQRRALGAEDAERVGQMFGLIRQLERVCFEPQTAGLIAVGGLKDDVKRDSAEVITDLEECLARTVSLGLRNALRLTLKDLYKAQGDNEKVIEHLRAMLTENDLALNDKADKQPAGSEKEE